MERSSPLAAMQPPSMPGPWALRHETHLAPPSFPGRGRFGPDSFNFKDLSMKRSSSDYFTLKPVRGSSPTASLAADLSQNFHIDQSPQLATPRRSLFTSALVGALGARETTTTPPLPSSSPGPGIDSMDISPLPHKAPFSVVTRIEVESPPPPAPPAAPVPVSPTDISTSSSSGNTIATTLSAPAGEASRPTAMPERSRPTFRRPSLVRTKMNSTGNVPHKSSAAAAVQLPPFKFGAKTATTATTLAECFVESPPHARGSPSCFDAPITLIGPPRPRQSFASMINSARHGSPLSGHVRKPSMPAARPRKLFRRSLSMFEHPGDVLAEESLCARPTLAPAAALPSIMDLDEPAALKLPHFVPADRPDSLPRITKETLIDVLDGRYAEQFQESVIVDCRFEYEYEGGHIDGALNYNGKELLAASLFEKKMDNPNTLLVFHCEYSAHRAPIMAEFIRGQDRTANDHRYPKLSYPEVYILDGGYSAFYGEHRSRCVPQNYVEMHAKEHVSTCEREMGKLRHRKKLSRAQTFAFGQHAAPVDDSPTAPGRFGHADTMLASTMATEQQQQQRRAPAQRMASY